MYTKIVHQIYENTLKETSQNIKKTHNKAITRCDVYYLNFKMKLRAHLYDVLFKVCMAVSTCNAAPYNFQKYTENAFFIVPCLFHKECNFKL